MVDDIARVSLHNPAADSGVIQVPESEVDTFLAAGWERVGQRSRRRADTGSTPIQSPRTPRADER
jgi:hypothetical protein